MKKVWSFGCGVNGVAMAVACVRSGDKPDAILFADTGGEKRETYEYLKYFSDWLVSKGFPAITVVTYKNKKGRRITLEQDVLENKTLPSVAFGFKTCSQKHKIFPQHKFVDYQWGKESVTWYVGYDSDELRRAVENPVPHYSNKYPLIELVWNREECVKQIESEGLRVPPKSACFFCPNMKKDEILALPEEYKLRAITIETNAEGLIKVKGLGRRFSWKDLIFGKSEDADKFEKDREDFKRITGDELEPIICECT